MQTKQADLLNIQGNAENNPKQNYPLIEREQIEKTPFTLVKLTEKWFISIGNIRLTEPTETKEEQLEILENEKWNITLALIAWTIDIDKELTAKDQITMEFGKPKTE